MQRVFLSHSSKDREKAECICSSLEDHGLRCWMAPRDIPPGDDWTEAIVAAIDDSSILVLLVSANSIDSPHVRREVERAVSRRMKIVPIYMEKVDIPLWMQYCISAHQWIDASGSDSEKRIVELALALDPTAGPTKDDDIPCAIERTEDAGVPTRTRRRQVFRGALLWYLGGSAFFAAHLIWFLLGDNPGADEIRNRTMTLSGSYVFAPAYGLLTGMVGALLSWKEEMRRLILSALLIMTAIGMAALIFFSGSSPDDAFGWDILLLFTLPFSCLATLLVSGSIILVRRLRLS